MKKVALSLAGVLAAAAFAPEASAVPAFARQTGMACSACHFQHFPLLNGFGRAFKNSGFTLMGAQGKVEGEHLSIPDTLNMAVLGTIYWQQESGTTANGRWGVPASGGELSLFYGGRISEFAGFLSELGAAGAAGTAAAKMPILFEVADGVRAGVVAFTTGGQGAGYSFETLNTGADGGVHRLMGNAGPSKQHGRTTSAAMFLGGGRTNATGVAAVVNHAMGFVNVAKYETVAPGFGTAAGLPLTYVRGVFNFDAAGLDMAAGVQIWRGKSVLGHVAEANVVDFQAQGEMGVPLGIYASYGTATKTNAATGANNLLNPTSVNYDSSGNVAGVSTHNASSFNVAVEAGVVPGKATVMAGLRRAKLGISDATGAQVADNAIIVGATYELAQNMELSVHHTRQSGSAWNTPAPVGQNATTVLLETMF